MTYRRFHRQPRPSVRGIIVKYAGKCACCGATINAGEHATYYPVGTLAHRTEAVIGHPGGLDGDSARCSFEIGKTMREQAAVNAYAGDGLDARYEDDCAAICGD